MSRARKYQRTQRLLSLEAKQWRGSMILFTDNSKVKLTSCLNNEVGFECRGKRAVGEWFRREHALSIE